MMKLLSIWQPTLILVNLALLTGILLWNGGNTTQRGNSTRVNDVKLAEENNLGKIIGVKQEAYPNTTCFIYYGVTNNSMSCVRMDK